MRDSPEDIDIEIELFDFDLPDEIFDLSDEDFSELAHFKHDELGIDPEMANFHNQRKTVRYIRNDITAFIRRSDIFGGYSLFPHSRAIDVKLLDISSKGALVASTEKIRINKKVMLSLIFDANKKFEIQAKIIREAPEARKFYGLIFESMNHDLGDYLIESQTELIFK